MDFNLTIPWLLEATFPHFATGSCQCVGCIALYLLQSIAKDVIRFRQLLVLPIWDQGKDDYREGEVHLEEGDESLLSVGFLGNETPLIGVESGIFE